MYLRAYILYYDEIYLDDSQKINIFSLLIVGSGGGICLRLEEYFIQHCGPQVAHHLDYSRCQDKFEDRQKQPRSCQVC